MDVTLQATQRETADAVAQAMRAAGVTTARVVFFEPFLDGGEYGESQLFVLTITDDEPREILRQLRQRYARRAELYPGAAYRQALAALR